MSLIDAYRLHISGGTFNEIQRLQQNEYHVGGDLVQRHGENGINILHRNIARDAFYNSEQRFPPPQCHPNTRTAVQDTIQCWGAEADQLQAPSVMWLYGPAGAGKSAVAQTMAEKWATEDALAAAFFFGRWRAGGSSGERLFPTIAYQLALHVSALRNAIALAVEADPAICDKAMEEQARALIVNPLRDLDIPPARPYAVIIDGLDECNDKSMQARIVKIIFQIFFENKLPLRFLICSRPEPYIREAFESLPPHAHFRRLVLDETFNPGRDILTYLRDRFSDIQMRRLPNYFGSWPTERDLDKLVHNASGQFIYPATVIKFVDDEYCHPMEQLQLVLSLYTDHRSTSPLADLDTLYTFILSVNPNTSLLVRILGTYFAIPNPDDNRTHSISFLDNILGVAPGSVRSALRGLHSLLFMADSDTYRIRLHHASLHDFLFNPNRAGRFFLDITQHHRDLAARCFSIVLANFQSPQQYSPESIAYSHFHWENHYRSEWEHRSAIQSCLEHFRHSLRPPRVASLCQDAEVMTLRFIGMIDFLNSLEKMLNRDPELAQGIQATWDSLLQALFDPRPEIVEFYEAWGTEYSDDGKILQIYSSMGFVIQRLWGGYLENFFQTDLTPSRRITRGFLHQTHPPQLRYWAAKIALRLLMCRTAEIRHKIQSKLEIPWGLSLRRGSHWSFATQWCTLLIQAPPVNELLLMLWQLTENTFYCLPEEIERKKLVKWLKKFGEVADPLVNIFEVGDRWKPMWYERHDLWVYAEQKEWSAIGFADKPRRRLQGVDALLTLR